MSTNQIAAPATFSAFDADALLAELDNTQDDIYDTARDAGIMARESLDQGRYVIGDLAVCLGKRYGADVIGRFADDIGSRPPAVREYRRVCAFWQRDARRELFDEMPGLSYSMLRTSIRFKSPQLALDFLRKCVDEDWKCERAHMECNRLLGSEAPEMVKIYDKSVTGDEMSKIVVWSLPDMPVTDYQKQYRIVVYEYSEDAK